MWMQTELFGLQTELMGLAMRNTTDMVVLGIGKVYKSTVFDIITISTSSAHARASGGGSFRVLTSDNIMLHVRAVL